MILPTPMMKMEDWLSLKQDYDELYINRLKGNIEHNIFRSRAGIKLRPIFEHDFFQHKMKEPKQEWEKELFRLAFINYNPKIYIKMHDEMIIFESESEMCELLCSDSEQDQFKLTCILTRNSTYESHLENIDKMIQQNVSDYYTRKVKDKKHYLCSCQWFVTVQMFKQLPYVFSPSEWQRSIYNEIMKCWNPSWFVLRYCTKLNEIFEKL